MACCCCPIDGRPGSCCGLRQRDLRGLPRRLRLQPHRLPAEARRTSSTSAAGSTCWARSRPSGSSSSPRCSAGSPEPPGPIGELLRRQPARSSSRTSSEPRPVRDVHHAPVGRAGLVAASVVVLQVESRVPDANITTGGDALWWAIVTITTVGYGDSFPVTTLGRLTGVFVMFAGVGIIGALASILASLLVPPPSEDEDASQRAPAGAARLRRPERHRGDPLAELAACARRSPPFARASPPDDVGPP